MPLDIINTDARPGPDDPFSRYAENSRIFFPVVERPLGWQNAKSKGYHAIPSYKAIVRQTEEGGGAHVLSVVGSNYKLVQNRELFSHVEDTLAKKMQRHELDGVQVKEKVAYFGRLCMREYIFPNIKCTLGNNTRSEIAFRLIVQNGYGESALRVHAGAIDFYCTNGMIRGEYQSAYRKHTKGLEITGISNVVNNALITFADSQNLWRKWVNTPVRPLDAMELFRTLANSDRLRENLGDQYMRERDVRGENLWAVYSTLTYYASHSDGEFSMRSTVDAQDSAASTMLKRELSVARWTDSDAWHKLEEV